MDKSTVIIGGILIIYSLTAGSIGYFMKDSQPPIVLIDEKIVYATSTEEVGASIELEELSKLLYKQGEELKAANVTVSNCWYEYQNNCNMDCVVCEECENFGPERDKYLAEINSLQLSRQDCRNHESDLAKELRLLKIKYSL